MSAHNGMLSVRHPNMHDIMVEATQAPAPSHSAAVIAVPPVHDAAAPQDVVLLGNVHDARWAAVPSHLPAQAPAPVHAARGVVDGEHVPLVVPRLHDSQLPVQLVSQHTPSTQFVLAHSAPMAHAVPLLLPTQVVPFMQTGLFPLQVGQHSLLAMHVPLHIFCVPEQPVLPPVPGGVVPPLPTIPPVPGGVVPPVAGPTPPLAVLMPPAPPLFSPPVPVCVPPARPPCPPPPEPGRMMPPEPPPTTPPAPVGAVAPPVPMTPPLPAIWPPAPEPPVPPVPKGASPLTSVPLSFGTY